MTSVNMANHSFSLTDKLSPYFTAENNLKGLLEWSNRIMPANVGILDKGLRGTRNIIEQDTGIRITSEGIEYRRKRFVKKLVIIFIAMFTSGRRIIHIQQKYSDKSGIKIFLCLIITFIADKLIL